MEPTFYLGVSILLVILYAFRVVVADRALGKRRDDKIGLQRPTTLEYAFPILKSTIPFLFDGPGLFKRIKNELKNDPVITIGVAHDNLYVVKDTGLVNSVLKSSAMTVTHAYGIALRNCFGMSKRAASDYIQDKTGSLPVPLGGKNTPNDDRIGYSTHTNLHKLFLGPGLPKMMDSFEQIMVDTLKDLDIPDEGLVYDDLYSFCEIVIGSAVIKSVFGRQLLQRCPSFLDDLWSFDKIIMQLARCTPRIFARKAYTLQERLIQNIKSWHTIGDFYSVEDVAIDEDAWGSQLLRERAQMLISCKNQTAESVASTDLALIWAAVTNVVPSSATLLSQVLADSELVDILRRLTSSVRTESGRLPSIVKHLQENDLMMSMYAETLRFGVQIHIPRTHPHTGAELDNMLIPRDKLILMSTWLAHNNEDVFDTAAGKRSLDQFWNARFLAMDSKKQIARFSLDGLEGSWIPFGGGHHACPGRVLAKHIMLLSTALMLDQFKITVDYPLDSIAYGTERFGFGVRRPKHKLPVRLRRRQTAWT